MFRNIENHLLDWKKRSNRKPMILRGARQVGKTFTIQKFAKEHYAHFLKINLEQQKNLHSIFESLDPKQIVQELTALFQVPLTNEHSLLFIDEIQVVPKAIQALRYFYEEMPELHVISVGSLLDHTLNKIAYSMPVGRVEYAYMYPMSFYEFLMAIGENGLLQAIKNYQLHDTFSSVLHSRILDLLRLYYFIGGMPEAVKYYVENKELSGIEQIHSDLISSIQFDFAKYGTRKQQESLIDVLNYAANNIGKKVVYTHVSKHTTSQTIKDAFQKLEMSRIIHLVRQTKSATVPLSQYQRNDVFKPVFYDIGLVNHLAGIRLVDIQNVIMAHEGALAEQFVLQELISNNQVWKEFTPFYWLREAKNSNAEIDCIIQLQNEVFPVEIKAGKRGTLKSLHVYLAEKGKKTGIRFNADVPSIGLDLSANLNLPDKNQISYNLISLPLYMAGILRSLSVAEVG